MRLTALAAFALGSNHVIAQQRCERGAAQLQAAGERFEDNGDGTVTDRTSKLMWARCSTGQAWADGRCTGTAGVYPWQSAAEQAVQINRQGTYFYNDWRLPQLRELAMLVERDCTNPRLNLTLFPDTPEGVYWTSTSRPGTNDSSFAYAFDFGAAGLTYQAKEQRGHVRLVRGSQ